MKTLGGTSGQMGVRGRRKKGRQQPPRRVELLYTSGRALLAATSQITLEIILLADTSGSPAGTLNSGLEEVTWPHAQSQQQRLALIILFPDRLSGLKSERVRKIHVIKWGKFQLS